MTESKYPVLSNMSLPVSRKLGKYPFSDLEVGQCFVVPLDDEGQDPATVLRRVQGSVTWANRTKAPKRFVSRKFPDENRVGVWRKA